MFKIKNIFVIKLLTYFQQFIVILGAFQIDLKGIIIIW